LRDDVFGPFPRKVFIAARPQRGGAARIAFAIKAESGESGETAAFARAK
jgi:hypothetical protein